MREENRVSWIYRYQNDKTNIPFEDVLFYFMIDNYRNMINEETIHDFDIINIDEITTEELLKWKKIQYLLFRKNMNLVI